MEEPYMSIDIRPAVPDDWPTIVDFNCRLAEESEGKALDCAHVEPGVKAVLADPRKGRYFIAKSDGRPVGQLMHTREWSDWRNGDIWWLQSVYVHRDFRRQGVFRGLFDRLKGGNSSPGVRRINVLGRGLLFSRRQVAGTVGTETCLGNT
jgi:GNAT superfamily N-acetyltransferase